MKMSSLSSPLSLMVAAQKRRPTPRMGVVRPVRVVGWNTGGASGEDRERPLLGEVQMDVLRSFRVVAGPWVRFIGPPQPFESSSRSLSSSSPSSSSSSSSSWPLKSHEDGSKSTSEIRRLVEGVWVLGGMGLFLVLLRGVGPGVGC